MPTYEYQCLKCKKKFDRLQKMSDKPLKSCVYCKGKVERLIGAGAGLIFKGSGFYETDYKRPKRDPDAGACGSSKSDPCASCPKTKTAKKKG